MAIQPIDIQTLFTQVEKVGKIQASQKEGLAIQQALQGIQVQKKVEAQIQSVNEPQNMGEGSEGVRDRNPRKQPEEEGTGREEAGGNTEKDSIADPVSIIRDPTLGKNIDING
ncbi:MAG: hypothetical protein LBP88_02640 [Treponema sp.]|jgi:hypothetical protein|nr:hypothetical protein [Treponema sp.]